MAQPSIQTLAERVLRRCQRDDVGCLVFSGAKAKGYGRVGYYAGGGKQVVLQTHRVVWEAENGPIPDGLTIEHECANRACQDTTHMTLMTRADNSRAGSHRNPIVIANRAKTHCPEGHEYSVENTYSPPTGGRYCRECGRNRTRLWRERNLYRERAKARDRHRRTKQRELPPPSSHPTDRSQDAQD